MTTTPLTDWKFRPGDELYSPGSKNGRLRVWGFPYKDERDLDAYKVYDMDSKLIRLVRKDVLEEFYRKSVKS